MEKVELTKSLRELYTATRKVKEVIAERGVFLCVDGKGDPGGEAFQQAVDPLYAVAYAIRNRLKKTRLDFKISRLECRWMCDPKETPRSEWTWRVMMRIPDAVTQNDLKEARRALLEKRGVKGKAVKRVSWREGRALQIIYVGPYHQVKQAYTKLHAQADVLGYRVKGPGHEIYLNKPRKVAASKLKTIVRLPIAWPRPDYARGPTQQQSER